MAFMIPHDVVEKVPQPLDEKAKALTSNTGWLAVVHQVFLFIVEVVFL